MVSILHYIVTQGLPQKTSTVLLAMTTVEPSLRRLNLMNVINMVFVVRICLHSSYKPNNSYTFQDVT